MILERESKFHQEVNSRVKLRPRGVTGIKRQGTFFSGVGHRGRLLKKFQQILFNSGGEGDQKKADGGKTVSKQTGEISQLRVTTIGSEIRNESWNCGNNHIVEKWGIMRKQWGGWFDDHISRANRNFSVASGRLTRSRQELKLWGGQNTGAGRGYIVISRERGGGYPRKGAWKKQKHSWPDNKEGRIILITQQRGSRWPNIEKKREKGHSMHMCGMGEQRK